MGMPNLEKTVMDIRRETRRVIRLYGHDE